MYIRIEESFAIQKFHIRFTNSCFSGNVFVQDTILLTLDYIWQNKYIFFADVKFYLITYYIILMHARISISLTVTH